MRRFTWTAPSVHSFGILPTAPVLSWVQGMADAHFAGEGEVYDQDSELALPVYPFCASLGAVRPHTDELDGEAVGKLVYGWVLRSDGHRVHTLDCPDGLPLAAGDLYCIDPLVRHWTTCPTPNAQLIFMVSITPPDARTPKKLTSDFRMDAIVACIEAQRAAQREVEVATYRGIEP
jgi:hypothetical protein